MGHKRIIRLENRCFILINEWMSVSVPSLVYIIQICTFPALWVVLVLGGGAALPLQLKISIVSKFFVWV